MLAVLRRSFPFPLLNRWHIASFAVNVVLESGIEPRLPELGAQSLSHWTTREVSNFTAFFFLPLLFYFFTFLCLGLLFWIVKKSINCFLIRCPLISNLTSYQSLPKVLCSSHTDLFVSFPLVTMNSLPLELSSPLQKAWHTQMHSQRSISWAGETWN